MSERKERWVWRVESQAFKLRFDNRLNRRGASPIEILPRMIRLANAAHGYYCVVNEMRA